MNNMARAGVALSALLAGVAFADKTPAPYPLEQWAMRDVIRNVSVSPDGTQVALMKIPNRDGNPIIEIYDAASLAKKPFRLNADPMELTIFRWLNDDLLLFGARQAVSDQVERREQNTYKFVTSLLDLQGEEKRLKDFDQTFQVERVVLPKSPNKVILSMAPPGLPKVSEFAKRVAGFFEPRDYYEFDLRKRTRKLLAQGRLAIGGYNFDGEGSPWLAQGYDSKKHEGRWLWRPVGTTEWQEYHRQSVADSEFDPFLVQARDDTKPNHVLVSARNGHDTAGLWSYDLENKRFAELIFRHPEVDISGVVAHSNRWAHPDTTVGVWYHTDKWHIEYFDEAEAALHKQLEGIVPVAHNISIASRSRDGATLVVANTGPRDPGTYYLVKGGKLQTIGSRQPLFASENLADVEFVKYRARDGRELFAYVTIPKGEPPFPLVVMPHGGPQSRDGSSYDKWRQLLANYGYLVIQPQFRGSTGFGRGLREAAFEDSGQEGRKMQDDNDDAALYLVKRGLADKHRMAMFGWSYGGYAAAVAASRTPQLYQCTIAGAGVFDPVLQFRWDRRNLLNFGEEIRDRYLAYEAKTIRPVEEVAKVNVPILVVHGVVDYRVLVDHATKYVKLLEEHKKPHKYVRLEGAGHFYNTLLYDHQLEFFTAMIDFLHKDCDMGGHPVS